jgi:hypothetical protein
MQRGLRISIRQTRAAIRSARVAEHVAVASQRAIEVLQRADIVIDGVNLSDSGFIAPGTRLDITLANKGQTRAERVKVSISVLIDGKITNPNPTVALVSVIASGVIRHITLGIAAIWLGNESAEAIARIARREILPEIKIDVSYRDVFGNERSTVVGGILDPIADGFRLREFDSN